MSKEQKGANRRVSKYELELRLQEVQRLLDKGLKIKEIAKEIGVPVSSAGRYIQKVSKRNKLKWDDLERESLESRAIKIKAHYEKVARLAEERLDDPDISVKDMDIAAKLLIGSHINIYNMLKDGPLKLPSIKTKPLEDMDD
jgi:predicted transcriptional regulator